MLLTGHWEETNAAKIAWLVKRQLAKI